MACSALGQAFNSRSSNNKKNKKKLPPGPLSVPILGSLLWLRRSPTDIESVLRDLHSKYGPIFTVHVGSRPFIFILDRSLAHKVLIEHGAVFSDRPSPPSATRFLSMNQHNVSSSPYGPLWRLLRRNLISEILHPSRVKLFSHGREWVLDLLLSKLHLQSSSVVTAMDSFRCAMFSLLVLMCFGEKLDEDAIKAIKALTDDELVVLCSEFLSNGTETTVTALEWIMASVVKYPNVQAKMREEIERVAEDGSEVIKEEELQRMVYVKAVVMEGLRRHPPAHLVLPHSVSEEIVVEGYVIPKNASINFGVAEMGWDEKVWEEPMEFRPERFVEEGVDVTGSREIKMMPFGVGRRICPGLGLAVLHLEYFVANLVREFEWREVEGEDVDLAEKPEFTVVMKHPFTCVHHSSALDLYLQA
ncbi:hypothetical protein J5N97_021958 [Dioscorea zingiberensis]|uniref:Cytochrome P450 n=1 Tax=Dioscorea zingiberensis TaxID=325984 RepID=A0A9D5C9D0_9LILI|nr:hypothetical protein J5N97_021958 [Dioscorea zingiberensis]